MNPETYIEILDILTRKDDYRLAKQFHSLYINYKKLVNVLIDTGVRMERAESELKQLGVRK